MKNVVFAGLFAAFLFGSVQGGAFSQGQSWLGQSLEQRINSAWGRAGVLRYNAALQIDSAGYDSDIYFGLFDQPVPDYLFSLGPDLNILLPVTKRIVFDIADSPRYVFFAKTVPERTLNNTFNGNLHIVFDRVYIQGGAGLVNAKERLNPELNVYDRLKSNDYSGLILWQASQQASFAFQYQRTKYAYEDLSSEPTDIGVNLDRTESFARLFGYLQQRSRARFYDSSNRTRLSEDNPCGRTAMI